MLEYAGEIGMALTAAAIAGAPFPAAVVPDTPEYRASFARLQAQVADIVARGNIPDMPAA
jgi:hypothetical protein